ncbi:MAG: PEP-CTERM sorting domain-containing protein [Sphingomonadaceae bacterium]|nr:PEP-CTERM sorting domain-containing protein [Sphingomonadaceae bacterium]
MRVLKVLLTTAASAVLTTASADAASLLVFKLGNGASTIGSLSQLYLNGGAIRENEAAAQSLSNSSLDYRNATFLDTPANWATVQRVDVQLYNRGTLMRTISFSPGSSYSNFFTQSNVIGGDYPNLATANVNFFSIPGDANYNRNFFINQNYGGCGNDAGYLVVLGVGGAACSWESDRYSTANRAFLYSRNSGPQNWNDERIGQADVFAISVNVPGVATPAPTALALFGLGALALGLRRR